MLNLIAVETADVVQSTALPANLFARVDAILNDELSEHKRLYASHFQRFRGDAYQVSYTDPRHAVKCALLTRLRLHFDVYEKPVHLTQSIAVGKQDKSNMMGSVYIQSGRLLDSITKRAFSVSGTSANGMQLASLFLTDVIEHLTQKQAQALYWHIKSDFSEHHQVAEILNTTRQNASIHLSRGKAELIKTFIREFEHSVTQEMQV